MKRRTNCPNCGGPLPVSGLKCEFCGTRIIDLTMIDFDSDAPTMFVLKAPKYMVQDKDVYISMWARPELESISMERDERYVVNARGERVCSCDVSNSVAFEMSLHPCTGPKNDTLYTLTIEEN